MTKNSELIFASELDQPVRYIERTRNYYLGLGYEIPYVWAHYLDVPFSHLKKPLNQSFDLITSLAQTPAKIIEAPASATTLIAFSPTSVNASPPNNPAAI